MLGSSSESNYINTHTSGDHRLFSVLVLFVILLLLVGATIAAVVIAIVHEPFTE